MAGVMTTPLWRPPVAPGVAVISYPLAPGLVTIQLLQCRSNTIIALRYFITAELVNSCSVFIGICIKLRFSKAVVNQIMMYLLYDLDDELL